MVNWHGSETRFFPQAQIEILVVDDGSTDRTPGMTGNFDSPRVRLLRKVKRRPGIRIQRGHSGGTRRNRRVSRW